MVLWALVLIINHRLYTCIVTIDYVCLFFSLLVDSSAAFSPSRRPVSRAGRLSRFSCSEIHFKNHCQFSIRLAPWFISAVVTSYTRVQKSQLTPISHTQRRVWGVGRRTYLIHTHVNTSRKIPLNVLQKDVSCSTSDVLYLKFTSATVKHSKMFAKQGRKR